jgi:hypothetical protein
VDLSLSRQIRQSSTYWMKRRRRRGLLVMRMRIVRP